MIDLRSDTVTKPSKEMLQCMTQAEVGDDVYGEDPTVIQLEQLIAEKSAMEAAVFCPSGTQSNLIALMSHCQRGDEYIVGQSAHTYMWEGGGAAVLGSIQPQPLDFEADGTLDLNKINMAIKPIDVHHARTKLVCLENTTSGKVLPLDYLKQFSEVCQTKNLKRHLDGARVFNAAVKLKVDVREISQYFDSVSICLSKGLGTPVGSVLCGSRELIREARHWRKMLGGGMRQAGYLAAAGIYALQHNIERLAEDHDNAAYLATELDKIEEINVDFSSLQTNIFFITIKSRDCDYNSFRDYLFNQGIIFPKSPNKSNKIRLVIHLDVSRSDLTRVIHEIKRYFVS
jgi:threonine aldolase